MMIAAAIMMIAMAIIAVGSHLLKMEIRKKPCAVLLYFGGKHTVEVLLGEGTGFLTQFRQTELLAGVED